MAGKKKRVVKKRAAVKTQPLVSSSKIIFSKFKFGMVLRNLVLFVLLALISWILSYYVFDTGVFADLFYLLLIIFGFVSLAFFIALLVLLFLKWIKR